RFVDELPPQHVEVVAELGLKPGVSWDAGWTNAIEVPATPWRSAPLRPPLLVREGPVPRRGEEGGTVGGFAVGGRGGQSELRYGTVTEVEDNKLAVHFDVAGNKKVMDAFVERA